jgi:large subunit ribosomal protein L3
MKFTIGTKDSMTQIFDNKGYAVPVTVINVEEATVTQIKELEKDGYNAIQIATGTKKKLNKALKGHFKELTPRYAREFRVEDVSEYTLGDVITAGVFEEGDKIQVSGITKGKGFQGGVKRHGFSGGRGSHGNKHAEREVGSIGAMGPARVFKGIRGPGRMGADRVTVKNLIIVKIDKENGRIMVKGAIPGKPGTLIEIVKKNA